MFLDAVQQRNPGLIRFAAELHRSGAIPPNTFVIDRGAVRRNAVKLADRAKELNISLYFMAKQIGYDEQLMQVINASIPGAVAVDWMGAETMIAQNIPLKHVGHLVPVPFHAIPYIMEQGRPEVWTIFDLEAAEAVNKVALSQGRRQPVLLRIAGHDLFPGQEGGFTLETILPAAERAARMGGLQLTGVTCYPCFTWDDVREKYSPNSNLDSVLLAAKQLRAAGYEITQINAPGNTSLSLLPLLAQYGVTHAEPGHALTGTTPEQGVGKSEEEPAVVYVSEVSMVLSSGKAQMYGGGLYARGHARSALVGSSVEELVAREPIPVAFPPAQYIDYQCLLDAPAVNTHVHTGDTVLLSFRFQLFVLRSYRAIVEQNARGDWELITVQPESNH